MYPYYLPSYSTLLNLHYRGHIERSLVAWEKAREKGISVPESKRQVDLELFLDEYPRWGLGTPHWSVVLHKMFLHAAEQGQKEVECMFCWGCQGSIYKPDPGVDQSTMELVGYHMSLEGDEGHLLQHVPFTRSQGLPPCGEQQRRWTIQDILSSLTDRLQRWAYPTATGDLDPLGGRVG